jgi:hypothetical protein
LFRKIDEHSLAARFTGHRAFSHRIDRSSDIASGRPRSTYAASDRRSGAVSDSRSCMRATTHPIGGFRSDLVLWSTGVGLLRFAPLASRTRKGWFARKHAAHSTRLSG